MTWSYSMCLCYGSTPLLLNQFTTTPWHDLDTVQYDFQYIYIYIYASLLWLHATIAKHSTTTPWHDLDTVQHDFQYILKKEKKEEENITYKFWNRLKVEDHPKLKGVFERVLVGFLKVLSFLYKKKQGG